MWKVFLAIGKRNSIVWKKYNKRIVIYGMKRRKGKEVTKRGNKQSWNKERLGKPYWETKQGQSTRKETKSIEKTYI